MVKSRKVSVIIVKITRPASRAMEGKLPGFAGAPTGLLLLFTGAAHYPKKIFSHEDDCPDLVAPRSASA